MFSFVCAGINDWVNNRKAGDLRCHCTNYDVTALIVGKLNQYQTTTKHKERNLYSIHGVSSTITTHLCNIQYIKYLHWWCNTRKSVKCLSFSIPVHFVAISNNWWYISVESLWSVLWKSMLNPKTFLLKKTWPGWRCALIIICLQIGLIYLIFRITPCYRWSEMTWL